MLKENTFYKVVNCESISGREATKGKLFDLRKDQIILVTSVSSEVDLDSRYRVNFVLDFLLHEDVGVTEYSADTYLEEM